MGGAGSIRNTGSPIPGGKLKERDAFGDPSPGRQITPTIGEGARGAVEWARPSMGPEKIQQRYRNTNQNHMETFKEYTTKQLQQWRAYTTHEIQTKIEFKKLLTKEIKRRQNVPLSKTNNQSKIQTK